MTKEELELLADALGDVGCWSWWEERFPRLLQLEFVGTELYLGQSQAGQPPDSQLALSFTKPASVSFLSGEGAGEDWPRLLREDQLAPLGCDSDRFTFTDEAAMEEYIRSAAKIETVFGEPPLSPAFSAAPAKLVFWAGSCGFAAAAEEIRPVSHNGFLTGPELVEAHRRWWDYWREYWQRRETATPLPKDYACEVTIPIHPPQ